MVFLKNFEFTREERDFCVVFIWFMLFKEKCKCEMEYIDRCFEEIYMCLGNKWIKLVCLFVFDLIWYCWSVKCFIIIFL